MSADRRLRAVRPGERAGGPAARMASNGDIVVAGTVVGRITNPQVRDELNGRAMDNFPPGGRTPVTHGDQRSPKSRADTPQPPQPVTHSHRLSVTNIINLATATSAALIILATGARIARWILG